MSWIWNVTSWGLLALGLGLGVYALFWDRPGFRGRAARRCKKCWYDLGDSGALPITCPECGRESKSERSMTRVRRHKKVVAVGVALMLAAPVVFILPMGVYYQRLPSWLLADLVTIHGTDSSNLKTNPGGVLISRLIDPQNQPSHTEIVGLIKVLARGNLYAPAGSERWVKTSGAWIGGQSFRFTAIGGGWQYPDGTPADDALNDAFGELTKVLPFWHPTTRKAWPADSRVTIYSGFVHPRWPVEGSLNERAVLRIKGHEDIIVDGFRSNFSIDPVGNIGDLIDAEIELSMFRKNVWDRTPEEEPAKVKAFKLEWRVVSGIDELVTGIDNEQIRVAMVEHVVPSIARTLDSTGSFDVWLRPEFDRVAFAIDASVFDGEELLGKSRHWWMVVDGKRVTQVTSLPGTSIDDFNAFGIRSIEARDKGTLRVVIRGVPEFALRIADAERAWNGEIDILYADAIKVAESSEYTKTEDEEKAP